MVQGKEKAEGSAVLTQCSGRHLHARQALANSADPLSHDI